MYLRDDPVGIAGVIPTICLFLASSMIVYPKTSWYLGASVLVFAILKILPVSLLNIPGACHFVVFPSSAGLYPFPFSDTMQNFW